MTNPVCDTCRTAVYDEFLVSDAETQDELARELGRDIGDHNCDATENAEPCGCGCGKTPAYQSPQGFTGKRMGSPSDGAAHSGSARGSGLQGKGS